MITNRIKRGPASTLPNGAQGEALFTTDTYDLYIGKGDGTNQRFQKYIASGTTSQYLRGDGSLETHNLDSLTDVAISSPTNNQVLKYNGSNWVNGSGFVTGNSTAAGQVAVWDGITNVVGYTTFTFDLATDKLSMTNAYVNNNLTVDGQLVIKSESGASAYTRGLKFPDNSYGGSNDLAGLRLTNWAGDQLVLELYVGNDSTDTINFAVAANGSAYNDNVTINGNKIWNVGNLPTPISSTGTINSGEIPIFSNGTTVYSDTSLFWDNSLNRLGVGGNSPAAQVGVTTSSGVNAIGYRTSGIAYYEMNLSFDATTYGYTMQVGRASGLTTAKPMSFLNNTTILSLDESNNVGVNILAPVVSATSNSAYGIDIYSSSNTVSAGIAFHTISSGATLSDGFRIMMRNDGSVFMFNQEAGGMIINAGTGNYEIITNAATSFKIDSSTNKIGINNPASIAEALTVNGSIQQSGVTSSVIKTDSNGKFVAAVAGTDYVAPSALSGYVPTTRTLTINGTAYDLSADRSWSVGTISGGGTSGRVAFYDGASSISSDAGFIYDSSTNRLGVNTTVPNAVVGVTASSGYGFLTKTADANYNGIGIGFDATYGNLFQTEKLGSAAAANLTLLNQSGYISVTEGGNVGINILSANPSTSGPGGIGLDIYASTTAAIGFKNATSGLTSSDGGRIYYNSTNMTIRNLETGNITITADAGNFQVITYGAENIKVEGSTGKVGIGAPASIAEMLTVNGSIQQSGVTNSLLKTNSVGKIIAAVAGTDYIVGNFDATATVRARTSKTTYRDNGSNPPTDAPVRSLTNDVDNWIYLDTASTEWGIYHRNIDATLSVAGQPDLPANSIAFIGANNLNAYICLSDGKILGKSFVRYNGTSSQFLKADGSVDGTSYQPLLSNPVIGSGSVGRLARYSGSSTIGDSLVYSDNNRAIAIGNLSTKSWASPFYVIEGGSYGQFLGFQTNGAAIKLGVNAYYNGANYIYTNTNYGIGILDINGDAINASLSFSTAPAGTAGNAATLINRFLIDVANNITSFSTFLGAGRNYTPTTSIEAFNEDNVNTVIQARRTGYGINGVAAISLAGENLSGVALSRAQIRAVFSSNTSSMDANMDFHTTTGTTDISSATLRMRINPGGNISIGSTNNSYKLDVTLPSGSNGQIIRMNRSAGAYGWGLGIDSSSIFGIYDNSGNRPFVITSSGYIGIGADNPEGPLHISGAISGGYIGMGIVNRDAASNTSVGIDFGTDGSSVYNGAGNAQINVVNTAGTSQNNKSEMNLKIWNGSALVTGIKINDAGRVSFPTATAQNYALSNSSAITVNPGNSATIASCTITTSGKPVFVNLTGDINPIGGPSWCYVYIQRNGNNIGKYIIAESTASSANVPFAVTTIDTPGSGTHTYTGYITMGGGNAIIFGETGNGQAPTVLAIELL